MKKSVKNFVCIFLCVIIPFIAVAATGFLIPAQFENTFLGELEYKVERLYSIDTPKIVIIGGSSVPFGVDSKLLEGALGMPVVNFGLYATLGTKLMLDLSRGAINKGDIIVIAPETDAQTYSLYFNAEAAWQAADCDFSLLAKMRAGNFADMIGGFPKFAAQKIKYASLDEKLDPDGVYNRASFDGYGDIIYPREYNVMPLGYDSSLTINFTPDIIDAEFIDYVNDYVKFAKKRGATVLFSFAPMNESAIATDTTLETLETFATFISDNFDAELISNPNDYIYRSGYFYDSNFHLNEAGAVLHTRTLALDIARYIGLPELLVKIDKPKVPQKPDEGTDVPLDYDENEKYFTFRVLQSAGKTVGYAISGISDAGKTAAVLTTPSAYNGVRILSIDEGAFAGCAATDIYITAGVSSIGDGAFAGAVKLKKIHILACDPNLTTVNNATMGLCEGLAPGAKFCVPADSYGDFVTNYFWGPYAEYIERETN
ncbi:MAG: hypothetical protein KBS59_01525 [Clostridiales bacterium]|nr:hypothetical protein [Clostridiales bacterium]